MNITDVGHLTSDADTGEDKMLKGAKREHKTVMEIAKYYTDAFFSDCAKLNIKTPDVVEPATNCIPEFIHMIEVLLEKGYAYIAGGILIHQSLMIIMYFQARVRKNLWSACVMMYQKIPINAIRLISYYGLPNPNSTTRNLNGTARGASVIRDGILSVHASV